MATMKNWVRPTITGGGQPGVKGTIKTPSPQGVKSTIATPAIPTKGNKPKAVVV